MKIRPRNRRRYPARAAAGKGPYFYIGCNGEVAAIDVRRGREVWRTRLRGGFFGGTRYMDVCVLEHEGRVYAGSNGYVFALDARTGRRVWQNELKGLGYNDVTLALAGKSIQFVASHTRSKH